MTDERVPINTPETLGVTPRYVLQFNAIWRSAHNLSATAQKLTVMAMALLPTDMSSLSASFTFTEFCKALGYGDGGEQYRIFLSAVDECMQNVISVETGKVIRGKKSWEKFTWFEHAKFDAETGVCTMKFSKDLANFLLEFKKMYSRINLSDIGRLQSKYGIRIFELAESYSSFTGKDGNNSDEWYFERTVPELRLIMGIPDDTYTQTRDFRRKVIEEPVREINAAGIGLEITTEGVKQGRCLAAIRFDCKKTPRTPPQKRRGRRKGSSKLPNQNQKTANLREEKELQHLKELYPEEFTTLYETEMAKESFLPFDSNFRQTAAESAVLIKLKRKHGVVK